MILEGMKSSYAIAEKYPSIVPPFTEDDSDTAARSDYKFYTSDLQSMYIIICNADKTQPQFALIQMEWNVTRRCGCRREKNVRRMFEDYQIVGLN